MTERMARMLAAYRAGESYADIGREHLISKQRVHQILLKVVRPKDRALHRARIEETLVKNRIVICKYEPCSKRFRSKQQGRKYCSRNCADLVRRTPFPAKSCEFCGAMMPRKQYAPGKKEAVVNYELRRFCNPECSALWRCGHLPPKP